jgi:hypothetical protein
MQQLCRKFQIVLMIMINISPNDDQEHSRSEKQTKCRVTESLNCALIWVDANISFGDGQLGEA